MIKTFSAALACGVCVVALASPAEAQVQTFRIPAGALKAALDAYVRQVGRPVIYDADQVRGVQSRGAQGAMSADQALDAILAGTSFRVERGNGGAVAVVRVGGSASVDVKDSQEIVVTAQKRAEVISKVPFAIQAFRGADLERRGATELRDVIDLVPGASEGLSNSVAQRQYQIRGVSTGNTDSTVGYYIDEAAVTLGGIGGTGFAPFSDTFDVDRVEVLRGPQGTLYGQSAMGGLVRFITAKPDLTSFAMKGQGDVSGTKGGDPNYSGNLAVNVPLVTDVLAVRGVVSYRKMGGYAESPTFPGRKNLNYAEATNYRFKALFQPSSTFSLSLGLIHNDVKDHVGTLLDSTNPPLFVQGSDTALNVFNTRYDLYTAAIDWDLDFATLSASSGYMDYKSDAAASIVLFTLPAALTYGRTSKVFNQEVRLTSPGSGPLKWVIGAYYQDIKDRAPSVVDSPIFAFATDTRQTSESIAGFGEVSVDLLDGRLTPLVGARYFHDKRKFADDNGLGTVSDERDTFNAFTPRFNLSFRPNDSDNYYVNIAKGFRSGSFNPIATVAFAGLVGIPAGPSIEPDHIWSYEVGSKGRRGALSWDVSLYRWDWSNIQTTVNPGIQVTLNAGKVRSYGIDAGISWQTPVTGLSLQLSGNLNDTKIKSLPAAVADAVPDDGLYVGACLPAVPKMTFAASGNYEFPLSDTWRGSFGGTYSYRASQITLSGGRRGDDHHLLSGRIGAETDAFGIFLYGENLLDDSGPIYNQDMPTLVARTRNWPRTIGIRARFAI